MSALSSFITALAAVNLFATAGLAAPAASPAASSSKYALVADLSGPQFFNNFEAFDGADPTNGFVHYLDMASAAENQLLGFIYNETTKSSNAYLGVDHTNVATTGRNSVRLTSKQTFDVGTIAVIDILHAPTGPSMWGAVWFLGSEGQWPQSGEIDIWEAVNTQSYVATTLHTSAGCTVDNSTLQLGTLSSTNCNAGDASDGCSVDAFDQDTTAGGTLSTAGKKFNQQGGGVYVMEWTTSGISVYMFSHANLPKDLTARKPEPSTWTAKPLAQFTGSGCDYSQHFQARNLIINIDVCGSWAGEVWESSGMATQTGVSTCNAYAANPANYKDAFFEFAGIQIYSSGAQSSQPASSKREETSAEFPTIDLAERHNGTLCGDEAPVNVTQHFGHHHAHPNGTYHQHQHGNMTAPCNETSAPHEIPSGTDSRPHVAERDSQDSYGVIGATSAASDFEAPAYAVAGLLVLVAAALL